mmetsp:Transcript_7118/g.11638  ORF Transcript_7118/g.11638 Transcript_7118/m.11638 type:complete len:265 (-) Transcript_7118:125-919(-)
MGQHAEGLGQPPLRKGVCGIALVVNGKGALETRVHQVGIELGHLLGQHHALVDDRAAGQARDIKARNLGGLSGLLDAATNNIKLTLKGLFVHILDVGNQDLLNLGPGGVGLFTQTGNLHGHMTPAVNIVPHAKDFGLHNGPAGFLRTKIGPRQKHLTDGDQAVAVRGVARALDLVIEKLDGDLHVNAGPVASLAIRIYSATVPDRLEGLDAIFDNIPALAAIHGYNETHAAGRMLFGFGIQTVFGHERALGFLAGNPIGVIVGH